MKKLAILAWLAAPAIAFAATAQSSEAIKKCQYQSAFAKNIATDRDDGLSYKNRLSKNYRLAYDMPDMRNMLGQFTKLIYFDLKNETPDGIGEATLITCLKHR